MLPGEKVELESTAKGAAGLWSWLAGRSPVQDGTSAGSVPLSSFVTTVLFDEALHCPRPSPAGLGAPLAGEQS